MPRSSFSSSRPTPSSKMSTNKMQYGGLYGLPSTTLLCPIAHDGYVLQSASAPPGSRCRRSSSDVCRTAAPSGKTGCWAKRRPSSTSSSRKSQSVASRLSGKATEQPRYRTARYDHGITTFDTANVSATRIFCGLMSTPLTAFLLQIYSNGLSEVVLGKAIKQFNLPREELVIMTKVRTYISQD